MLDIAIRLSQVRIDVGNAAQEAGRDPREVTIVAVSKTHPVSSMQAAWAAGQRDFGESYARELARKVPQLASREGIRFHFIGHLQTNKVKLVVGNVDLIHTVDRPSLVHELGRRTLESGISQDVLLEVHLSPEDSKSGASSDALPELLRLISIYPSLRPVGLMTMPPYTEDPEGARPYFRRLRTLRDELARQFGLDDFRHLSMGMSHDFRVAIQEGSTMVRVGTAIFGSRLPD